MASKISSANESRPKGRLMYEGLLKTMPQEMVRELAQRRFAEIAEYEKRQKQKTNQQEN